MNFGGGQKALLIERKSLFSKTINARIMIEVSLERTTMSNENIFLNCEKRICRKKVVIKTKKGPNEDF